jgi:hypothetical protein
MSIEQHATARHELQAVAAQFPDLSPTTPADEETLKTLQTKYTLLLQIADQSLRDRELRLKEDASRVGRWTNPLVLAVFAGAIGLAGTFVNGVVSNRNQQIQLQNDLIKEAIKPTTAQERAKSLVFFAKNGLITLDNRSLASLVKIAGTEQPVPGSSGEVTTTGEPQRARPIAYVQAMVNHIRAAPGTPYPTGVQTTTHLGDTTRRAIILHDATGGDSNSVAFLRKGMPPNLPGPLAHWAVQSDGTIAFIADETRKANHVGRAGQGLSNANTIGIQVTGIAALQNERQIESLVRLVADVADRWNIPTNRILSHAEVAVPPGRKTDMGQQAPVIREMVAAVRKRK